MVVPDFKSTSGVLGGGGYTSCKILTQLILLQLQSAGNATDFGDLHWQEISA